MEWEGVPKSGSGVGKGSRESSSFKSRNYKQAFIRRAEGPGRVIWMKLVKEIGWLRVIEDLESNSGYFKTDTLGDR